LGAFLARCFPGNPEDKQRSPCLPVTDTNIVSGTLVDRGSSAAIGDLEDGANHAIGERIGASAFIGVHRRLMKGALPIWIFSGFISRR
jgi:hypothetical protein